MKKYRILAFILIFVLSGLLIYSFASPALDNDKKTDKKDDTPTPVVQQQDDLDDAPIIKPVIRVATVTPTTEEEVKPNPVVIVKDTTAPVFTRLVAEEVSYPLGATFPAISELLTALDDTDGDVTDQIEITEITKPNMLVVGTYPVEFTVSDAAGNISTTIINVKIEDRKAPIITTSASIDIFVTKDTDEPDLHKYISDFVDVSDNYYSLTTNDVQIDPKNIDMTTVGTYEVKLYAIDGSNNRGELIIYVHVHELDNIPPTIELTERTDWTHFVNLSRATIIEGELFKLNDFVTITDLPANTNVEVVAEMNDRDSAMGTPTVFDDEWLPIKDGDPVVMPEFSIYRIRVTATDDSGNKTEFTFAIEVKPAVIEYQ